MVIQAGEEASGGVLGVSPRRTFRAAQAACTGAQGKKQCGHLGSRRLAAAARSQWSVCDGCEHHSLSSKTRVRAAGL